MIISLTEGSVWWVGVVCLVVVGKQLLTCYCIAMLRMGYGVGSLVFLGFSG